MKKKRIRVDTRDRLIEMGEEEIAAKLGISHQRVNKLLQNAIRKFRENWLEMFGEPPEFGTEAEEFELSKAGVVRERLKMVDYSEINEGGED